MYKIKSVYTLWNCFGICKYIETKLSVLLYPFGKFYFILYHFFFRLKISRNNIHICTIFSTWEKRIFVWIHFASTASLPASLLFFLILSSFTLHSLRRPIQKDDWRIDFCRMVVQSGLRRRVCVFQKCWRRLSRRSSSPRAYLHHPLPPALPSPLPSRPFVVFFLSLFRRAFSSSQNQWVECSRFNERQSAATKVREKSPDYEGFRLTAILHANRSRLFLPISTNEFQSLKFQVSSTLYPTTARRCVELLLIVSVSSLAGGYNTYTWWMISHCDQLHSDIERTEKQLKELVF